MIEEHTEGEIEGDIEAEIQGGIEKEIEAGIQVRVEGRTPGIHESLVYLATRSFFYIKTGDKLSREALPLISKIFIMLIDIQSPYLRRCDRQSPPAWCSRFCSPSSGLVSDL